MICLRRTGFLMFFLLLLGHSQVFGQLTADFSISVTSGCAPLQNVRFTDLSTGNPERWEWSISGPSGNIVSAQKDFVYTFPVSGTYTITLEVYRGTLYAKSAPKTVVVNPTPEADFTVQPANGCSPHVVTFTAQDKKNPSTVTQWEWNFGDGGTATGASVSHTYIPQGIFTVTLKATDRSGCSRIFYKEDVVNITGRIDPRFIVKATPFCFNQFTVTLQNTSVIESSTPVTYHWDFGDGRTSNEKDPVHTYFQSQIYNITLTVSNQSGCSNKRVIAVSPSSIDVNTDFVVPQRVCAGSSVAFIPSAIMQGLGLDVDSVRWESSNGAVSGNRQFITTFDAPGTYTVSLYAFKDGCGDFTSKRVVVGQSPEASFTESYAAVCALPIEATFTSNTTTGNVVGWSISNGAEGRGNSISTVFTQDTSYKISLVVSDTLGCRDTLTVIKNIGDAFPTIASMFPLPFSGCTPADLTFTTEVTGTKGVTSYEWDIGGTKYNQKEVSRRFVDYGITDVTLTVKTEEGCTLTKSSTVEIVPKPIPNFEIIQSGFCASDTVKFKNTSQMPFTHFIWEFGDGTSSQDFEPNFLGTDSGLLFVRLIAYNKGCLDTMEVQEAIKIVPPIAKFKLTRNCDKPREVIFENTSIAEAGTTYLWEFGDGTTSTLKAPPPHLYPEIREYEIKLTVTQGECTHTFARKVFLGEIYPDVSVISALNCPVGTLILSGVGPGVNRSWVNGFHWQLDGDTLVQSRDREMSFNYNFTYSNRASGLLTVEDAFGCTKSQRFDLALPAMDLLATFDPQTSNVCFGNAITIHDKSQYFSSSKIVERRWIFDLKGNPDKDTITTADGPLTIYYDKPGIYDIAVIVKDNTGCADTLYQYFAVQVLQPQINISIPEGGVFVCPNTSMNFNSQPVTAFNYAKNFWDFGFRQISYESNGSRSFGVQFAESGSHDVFYRVEDFFGCADSVFIPDAVTVGLPVPDFSMSDSFSTCPPLNVKFTNNSSASNLVWHFGDSARSELQNPEHTYLFPGIYDVKLVASNTGECADSITKQITVRGPVGEIQYDPLVGCVPAEIAFLATSQTATSFIWNFQDGPPILSNTPDMRHVFLRPGSYLPSVGLQDSTGCYVEIFGTDTIVVNDTPHISLAAPPVLCFGDSITLQPQGGVSYQWGADPTLSCTDCPNPVATPMDNKKYLLTAISDKGCISKDSIEVTVYKKEILSLTGLPDTICIGDPTMLVARGYQLYEWLTSDGQVSGRDSIISIRPMETTTYTVYASDTLGCYYDTAQIQVTVYPIPTVSFPEPVIKASSGTVIPMVLNYSDDVTNYIWTPATGLDCYLCPNPNLFVTFRAKYKIEVSNPGGCTAEAELTVEPICDANDIFIPNTFSPNGDGKNDLFYPRGNTFTRVRSMQIFNRWGEMVFERTNFDLNQISTAWDGTYKGVPLNPDVFVYVIHAFCSNNEPLTYKGNVTLLR